MSNSWVKQSRIWLAIRWWQWLVFIAVVFIISYVLYSNFTTFSLDQNQAASDNLPVLRITDPHITIHNDQGILAYTITAPSAEQADLSAPIVVSQPVVVVFAEDGTIEWQARSNALSYSHPQVVMQDAVELVQQSQSAGLVLKTDLLHYNGKDITITDADIAFGSSTIEAGSATIYTATDTIEFADRVVMHLDVR